MAGASEKGAAGGAASGASAGATFGPWGAAIGAIAGAIFGSRGGKQSNEQRGQNEIAQYNVPQVNRILSATSADQANQYYQDALHELWSRSAADGAHLYSNEKTNLDNALSQILAAFQPKPVQPVTPANSSPTPGDMPTAQESQSSSINPLYIALAIGALLLIVFLKRK